MSPGQRWPSAANRGPEDRWAGDVSSIARDTDTVMEAARPYRRRHLRVVIGTPGCWAEVSGWRARDLLVECGLRSPVWLPRLRAWSTSASRARDVIALAERYGYEVTVVEGGGRRC